jgi:phage shock protein A
MQITSTSTPQVLTPGANAGNATAVDGTSLGLNGENAATATPVTPTPNAAAPLRRGLSNWDQPLQNDISGAQQALDFLEQSAAQLRNLKTDLSTRLATRQRADGALEARVRQFSNSWRNRSSASGGTLDAQLRFNTGGSSTTFSVRGMNLANLRTGGREVLAMSVGGGQNVRSVVLEPGLTDAQIAARFDEALAPTGVRVRLNDDGQLEFSTAEAQWTTVRDTIAVQGGGIRFPTGQLNRVKAEALAPEVEPDNWQVNDIEAIRTTLAQVVQSLAKVEQAIASVHQALARVSARVQNAALAASSSSGMEQMAQDFVSDTKQPGYKSLLSIMAALAGISRERVRSLLSLR